MSQRYPFLRLEKDPKRNPNDTVRDQLLDYLLLLTFIAFAFQCSGWFGDYKLFVHTAVYAVMGFHYKPHVLLPTALFIEAGQEYLVYGTVMETWNTILFDFTADVLGVICGFTARKRFEKKIKEDGYIDLC